MDRKEQPEQPLGARVQAEGVRFRLWAPEFEQVDLVLDTENRTVPMQRNGEYFERLESEVGVGARYRYRPAGGKPYPDPASRFQPEGVHGASAVVDPALYRWGDQQWRGLPLHRCVFYELHVGTFTPEGSFAAAAGRLPYLRELGVTAVELMPVGDFPGRWNWGYDPAAMYAPARAYGTPDDLRAFVDTAHQLGMAVFLDVIYNHFGPDGSYAAVFGKFFTDKHASPWGQGINLDDHHSAGVRNFFIDNALHWLREYHLDGLRLDATHALQDDSQPHFLAELAAAVQRLEPRRYLIAEDERNEAQLVRPRSAGGMGLDGVWADDFHHQVRNLSAGDSDGYFADFADTTAADLATTIRQGWFFAGQKSHHAGRPRGTDPAGVPLERFVHCIQNHDQVGNRARGDRLHHEIPPCLYRAVSALLLFSPSLPLLFMGQEWAASSPFQFFTDHREPLGTQVSEGRKREFQTFAGFSGEVPDPQDPATFHRSKLNWDELQQPGHQEMLTLYRELLRLRPELPSGCEVQVHGPRALSVHRGRFHLLVCLAIGQRLPWPSGAEVRLQTEDAPFCLDPQPAIIGSEHAAFARPGAILATTPQA